VTCVALCKGQRAAGKEPASRLTGGGEQARRGTARCGAALAAAAES